MSRFFCSDEEMSFPIKGEPYHLLLLLEKIGSAAILINRRGNVVDCNMHARQLLSIDGIGLSEAGADPFTSRTIQSVLTDMFGLVALEHASQDRRLAFRALDVSADDDTCRLIILIDLTLRPPACAPALEKIFGLTTAEGRLAAQLSNGISLASIARERKVSITTLRTQLASIFAKTGTSRQPELVALLARICRDPVAPGFVA